MNDCKELRIEAETFDEMRKNINIALQRMLKTMEEKNSMDGKIGVSIDIKLVQDFIPNYDQKIEGDTREILKPKFEHKVTSTINIKNEEKGTTNPEMAMIWDDEKMEYVLTHVNNTEQRSMFDTDIQEAMNNDGIVVEEGDYAEIMLLEGEVADRMLPGPEDDEDEDDGYGYEEVD